MGHDLTHLDARGRAHMVDVAEKRVTQRICVARGAVRMAPETLARIAEGTVPKGDVLATARLAGIQAAKRTDEWIPLCHSIPLDGVEIELTPDPAGTRVWRAELSRTEPSRSISRFSCPWALAGSSLLKELVQTSSPSRSV